MKQLAVLVLASFTISSVHAREVVPNPESLVRKIHCVSNKKDFYVGFAGKINDKLYVDFLYNTYFKDKAVVTKVTKAFERYEFEMNSTTSFNKIALTINDEGTAEIRTTIPNLGMVHTVVNLVCSNKL